MKKSSTDGRGSKLAKELCRRVDDEESPKQKFKEVDSFLWKQEKSEQARVSFLLKQNHEQLKEITKNVTLRF